MADIDSTSEIPEPDPACADGVPVPSSEFDPGRRHPVPSAEREPARHRVLDLVVLVALMALCAGVYLAVGDAGFSVIVTAVAGLFGTWRMRR
ncbi:hypothetical protein [Streptomyces sp. NPDC002132]|uniref:hypothetical protein n=1 Tax=unclassified Streptomyces TaxID=2593676 RepID=UPI003333E5FC